MFCKPLTEPISEEEQFREVSKILAIALHRIHKDARKRGSPPGPLENEAKAEQVMPSRRDEALMPETQ